MILKRYLHQAVFEDLREKMVFIGGPRQIGKTTLAKFIGKKEYPITQYLNWDNSDHRKDILQMRFDPQTKFLILDEIHKYKQWKNHIKGVYDTYEKRFDILVTGSARLDIYRKKGDSLQGRYHYYRLHPFSLGEIIHQTHLVTPLKELLFPKQHKNIFTIFNKLLTFGGFPEPYLSKSQKVLRRWHNERVDRLIREDIRDVELVRDLSALQVLIEILPDKVGSLFSLNALREDFYVAHKTIALWMNILEKFYFHFRIYPYSTSTIKSLRKEPKMYLWDWSQVKDTGFRLENMIASHLLKFVHYYYDAEGYKTELYFLRDIEGRAVDFLIAVNKKPWFAVEVKTTDQKPSKHLKYFGKQLKIPFLYQIVTTPSVDFLQDNIRVISADMFLSGLI